MATTIQLTAAQKKFAREVSGRTDIAPVQEDLADDGGSFDDAYDDAGDDVGSIDTSFDEDDRDYYEKVRDGDIESASSSSDTGDTAAQADEKPDTSWITDEAKEFGASYNLDEKAVAEFGSMEELERFGRAVDLAIRQRAPVSQEPKSEAPATDTESTSKSLNTFEPFDIEAMKAETENPYDEFSIRMAEVHNANLERMAKDQKAADEKAAQAEVMKFEQHLDGLDKTLFGTAVKDGSLVDLNPSFAANRRAVYENMLLIKDSLPEGQSIPENALIQRAVRATFGEVGRKADPVKVEKQSRKRRPARGANRGQNAGAQPSRTRYDNGEDEVKAIANSPKIKALWNRMQRENGME